jgi:polysaccharide export outer membrane protein
MATRTLRACVGALAGFVAFAATLAAQGNAPKISARDVLKVSVFGVDSMSRSYTVDQDGTIAFPEIGRIKAGGLTARELADALARKLADDGIMTTPPRITVDLERVPNQRVLVSGPGIRNQGAIEFAGELTVLEALARAGSTTPEAASEAMIVRGAKPGSPAAEGSEVLRVDLRALQGADAARFNLTLEDGDHLIVPKAQQVFIDGFVRSPGAYNIESGMTVAQALVLAGGATEYGAVNRIRITRKNAKGEDEELKNVKMSDTVKPGDLIYVPKKWM